MASPQTRQVWPADGAHLAVVSPHLDDAVLSCGQLIAARPGATVVTVFAGFPATFGRASVWDRKCGFDRGDDVGAHRIAEDDAALALLAARALRLPFLDRQYVVEGAQKPTVEKVAGALGRAFDDLGTTDVLAPLGLVHRDHRMAHEAALAAVAARPGTRVTCYVELPYRCYSREEAAARVEGLTERGWRPEAVTFPPDGDPGAALERKREAVVCYPSQVRGLTIPGSAGLDDVWRPEDYWLLQPPPVVSRSPNG